MVQSLVRAMDILEQLRDSDKACSIAEIAQRTCLPPSTVHRILQTFCSNNYVAWDEKTHLYHLGVGLVPLGMAATRKLNLREAAIPILNGLMQETAEDAFLMIASKFKGLVLERVDGPNHLKVIETFSSEWDLNCGGIRRSLLSFQSDSFIDSFIKHGLKKFTENTITNAEHLRAQIEQVRKEGVAASKGEYIPDAVGIGAPAFDRNGKAVASIGIIAPASRMSDKKISELKAIVKKYAAQLSINLGNVHTD